jgi:branched-chain amino acid transport system substrate-binding protein
MSKRHSAKLSRRAAVKWRTCGFPLANPDFSPFLQKLADANPDALLAFVPSGVGAQFMKQFVERGLDKAGIRFLAEGSVTSWTSPRGPITIDSQTRDIVQNVYIRKVERMGGELYNVEFATIPNVKDPIKAAKSN